ncbi:MAG: DUF4395 domain-containing protein [Actinomycetota bacterium]
MTPPSVNAPDVAAGERSAAGPRGWTRLLSFPDPVNEVAARLVAGGVVTLAVVTLVFRVEWMLWVLAYGFVARVLTGPTLSPLGQLVTRVIVPRLPIAPRPVPGPPKRFAQGIGATFTVSALVLAYGFGRTTATYVLIAALTVAASLEAFLGFCLGCKVFAVLMRFGLVPEQVCERCNNIWDDRPALPETRA